MCGQVLSVLALPGDERENMGWISQIPYENIHSYSSFVGKKIIDCDTAVYIWQFDCGQLWDKSSSMCILKAATKLRKGNRQEPQKFMHR